MKQQFEIHNAPQTPLRAEPRPVSQIGAAQDGAHIRGVDTTSGGLIRSTLLAGGAALAILTLFYLPAEYGVDPTGIGGLLSLTEMGDIKQQLYAEAAAQDAAAAAAPVMVSEVAGVPSDVAARLDRIDAQLSAIAGIIGADVATPPDEPAIAAPEAPAVAEAAPAVAEVPGPAEPAAPVAASGWRDGTVFTLAPTEAKEIKLVMAAGDVATFEWVSEGGGVNYTQHGDDGGANEVRFEDGHAAPGQDGTMTAPFAGKHGWFWRNRGDTPVTVTLRVGGAYAEMVEVAQP